MKRCIRHPLAPLAVAAALAWLPVPALAQQPGAERSAPPLPERVRTLDESLKQEQDELLREVTAAARDRGRLAAALKAQHAAWLQYRDTACALAGVSGGAADGAATRDLQCKAVWAEEQRMRLWSTQECLEQVPPAERGAELERCLHAYVSSLRP